MKPIGIYLHVPFCRGKCPYCDFYSVSVTDSLLDAYTDETVRRIEALAKDSVTADTVYFGGGTPSLLGGRRIVRLLSALERCIHIENRAEITAEANPSADLRDFLDGCAAAGVNRLSLGMQTAVPQELAALGRRHTVGDVCGTMEQARACGIDNLSLDLMLGIPRQTAGSLAVSLECIRQQAPAHVSAYMLKIEEGTPFYAMRHALHAADDDKAAALYEAAFEGLERMGYRQYEISNAARPGFEGRHNLHYWNGDEYIGIGPGAHSFFDGTRSFTDRNLAAYLRGEPPVYDGGGGDEAEYVMLRLRLADGLTHDGLRERFGHGIPDALVAYAKNPALAQLCTYDGNAIRLTRKGFLLSNTLIGNFIHFLSP